MVNTVSHKDDRYEGPDWWKTYQDEVDHPENDLHDDADFSNKPAPIPHTVDDLADAMDPAEQARRNRHSTKEALWWLAATIVLSFIVSFAALAAFRAAGGPYCEAGETVWLCSRSAEIWWALISCVVPIAGLVGCSIIMVRKLKAYLRWRPWMGIFWVLVPHAMLWMTTVGQIAIVGHENLGR
ncbi:putative integral membrane protein [Corynebacterium renale]|nr:putative integral membrane protein [Corynebacterium renale]STD00783.1 putative integral membrane protein [Corynebacterium renale]